MKKLFLIAIVLASVWTPVFACTAFYKSETVSGMNKICYYDHLGSSYAITVNSYRVCPTTVRASH